MAGGAVLAVGVWTLVEKSDYISLLNSGFYSASAYILIAAGAIVIVTGIIGCCATLKEMRSLLIVVRWISHTKQGCAAGKCLIKTCLLSLCSTAALTSFNYVESETGERHFKILFIYTHNLVWVYVY